MVYDVAVIGGGIAGTAVLSSLSHCGLRCVLLEKEPDIAMGTTKANSAIIHAGFAAETGTLMARLNVRGNALYHELEDKLRLQLNWCGSLVVAMGAEEEGTLQELLAQGEKNGVPGLRLIDGDEARQKEPQLSGKVTAALWAPSAGVCWPFGAALAFAEDAMAQGADIVRAAGVKAVRREADGTFCLVTDGGEFRARYAVNAAGVGAAAVSRLFGDDSFGIAPRKGEYLLFDQEISDTLVKGIVFPVPTKVSKGILVCRTVDGNVFVGPNAIEVADGSDTAVTAAGQAEIIAGGQRLLEHPLPLGKAITEFAGVRAGIRLKGKAENKRKDFLLGWSKSVPGLYQVAGIQSPGLSAAPAIGEYVAEAFKASLNIESRHFGLASSSPGLSACHSQSCADASCFPVRHSELDSESPVTEEGIDATTTIPPELFERIICRCEKVSEGEIIAAIRRPCGAVTIDGVKRRTRAGMGRCQGGFCGGKVARILARELGLPLSQVKKDGFGSEFTLPENGLESEMAKKVPVASSDGQASLPKERTISQAISAKAGQSGELPIVHRGIVIIGAGPAGLSAAYGAHRGGARDILIIERDRETGGVLQQCIHTGFGLHHFKVELTGPGYAERSLDLLKGRDGIEVWSDTTVLELGADNTLLVAGPQRGRLRIKAEAVVLTMGCRERPRGAIRIPGTRPAGVMTAGTAQRLINMEGYLPGKRAVILGSGDIGLIMARRLTLAGCEVVGVFELCPYSNGLARNVHQCLEDFGIPLYLSHTVTDIRGKDRISSVVISQVDSAMKPIAGSEFTVECDLLLLSVGLIPENELSREAGIALSPLTGGPLVNQYRETSQKGVFAAGNVVQVHDLVDFVSEEAELAGCSAALSLQKKLVTDGASIEVRAAGGIRNCVPQRLQLPVTDRVKLYMRVSRTFGAARLVVSAGGRELMAKRLPVARPSEMIVAELPEQVLSGVREDITVTLEELL